VDYRLLSLKVSDEIEIMVENSPGGLLSLGRRIITEKDFLLKIQELRLELSSAESLQVAVELEQLVRKGLFIWFGKRIIHEEVLFSKIQDLRSTLAL